MDEEESDEENVEEEEKEEMEDDEEDEEKASEEENEHTEDELQTDKLEATKKSSVVEEKLHVLTRTEASQCLCLLGKTAGGLEYAYLMIKANKMNLSDISIISSFPHILFVDVCHNQLKDQSLEILTSMEFLLMIKADENHLTTPQLSRMSYLQVLTLNKNEIMTIEGINHPLLECLELSNNQIKDVVGLDPSILRRLKVLELRGNSLLTTAGIYLPTLERLYLAENLIEKLEGFEGLVNLQILHLRDNPISNLDGFTQELYSLTYLNLRKCRIEDLQQIKKLACLKKLNTLIVSQNPCTEEVEEYRVEILVTLPDLKRLDKGLVTDDEVEEADLLREERAGGEEGEDDPDME